MAITPAEINGIAFRRPRPGASGYHEEQVDAFLEDVAGEMRRLEAENRALSSRLGHDDLAERVRRAELECLEAQERARALREALTAAREASFTPVNADKSGMLEVAQRTADACVDQARAEAELLVEQATTKAAQLLSDAQLRASTIVADARHAHSEAIAGIEAQRAATLDEISELIALAGRQRAATADDISGRLQEFTS
ncbi:cell division protein DivIVA [Actinoplanes sp. SE50]|uniref:DivIVA domain-containing protein n=1 Tax=unclassified Actinoplanes TaxID=2626549 RepID=UPI00023EC789|nr:MULTISPECIES: DivIVA domain-containing protein [unclassified Actinoplanes]AEV83667.1 Laminin subunit beta-2 [Actinoplanes sp. SE50/110]ATO82189.1 cell division protein DivIVA [Actinoplanes sp. SE50]SLL99596.1 cell division protein DivIVA [Actinoplanes sp. SE50/110]